MRFESRIQRYARLVNVSAKPSSHYVVRVRHDADAGRWWAAAARSLEAPAVIGALLAGRTRVEVSPQEAMEVCSWAEMLEGWEHGDARPLCVYPAASADP